MQVRPVEVLTLHQHKSTPYLKMARNFQSATPVITYLTKEQGVMSVTEVVEYMSEKVGEPDHA